MTGRWQDFPGAPALGVRVCRVADVPAGGTHSVELDGFPVILARHDGRTLGYINACPHQFLPLDYRSASVLSADGAILRCTNHEAGFDLGTGRGIDGFGAGCALEAVPVREDRDGWLIIG